MLFLLRTVTFGCLRELVTIAVDTGRVAIKTCLVAQLIGDHVTALLVLAKLCDCVATVVLSDGVLFPIL